MKNLPVKFCHKCRKQVGCIDTRRGDGRTRRRYRCDTCGSRWSTIEERINGSGIGTSVRVGDYEEQMRARFRAEFQTELKKLLGVEMKVPRKVRRSRGKITAKA